jgi:uncharacterized protein YoxC
MQLEYLVAAIAFSALAILFLIHYRKMARLESALDRSDATNRKLQASIDKLLANPGKLLICLQSAQTDEEQKACIKKFIEEK